MNFAELLDQHIHSHALRAQRVGGVFPVQVVVTLVNAAVGTALKQMLSFLSVQYPEAGFEVEHRTFYDPSTATVETEAKIMVHGALDYGLTGFLLSLGFRYLTETGMYEVEVHQTVADLQGAL